ncbi:MAG: FtsQ-type POTRA domain-containing protein [Candidatus Daviesbacteria bacterium]|nr:FtsQ-type POTRA domain-containing protein [Candidatus Daviesbacteria bacterium]
MLIILLIFFIIAVAFLFNSPAIKLKKIDVAGGQLSCTDFTQIKEIISQYKGNLLLINEQKIKDELKDKFICVGDIQMEKKFPDELKIQVFKRNPIALFSKLIYFDATSSAKLSEIIESTESAKVLNFSPSDQRFLVDKEGILFEKSSGSSNAPNVYLNEELTLGQIFSADLIGSISKIFEKLNLLGIPSGQFIIIDRRIFVYSSDKKIIFKIDGTLETQLASLQLIVEKAKINSDILEFIDLRFDKPVVRYGQGQNNLRN